MLRFLRVGRERGDDFFEPSVAPKWIPIEIETQFTVVYVAWHLGELI